MRRTAVVLALAVTAATSVARADTLPLNHMVLPVKVSIVNREEFPDWVVLVYPCEPEAYLQYVEHVDGIGLDPYCVVGKSGEVNAYGRLYALRSRDAKVTDPTAKLPPETRAKLPKVNLPLRVVDIIDAGTAEAFFKNDPRVTRLGVGLPGSQIVVHTGLRLAAAHYDVVLEREGDGLRARYRGGRFQCTSGPPLVFEAPRESSLPFEPPACPALDDRGEPLPYPSAPSPAEGQAPPPIGPSLERPRLGMFALGAAVSSLGLLGIGLLLRRRASQADGAEAQANAEADGVGTQRPDDGAA
jgi:hypothetical protein